MGHGLVYPSANEKPTLNIRETTSCYALIPFRMSENVRFESLIRERSACLLSELTYTYLSLKKDYYIKLLTFINLHSV